jgi:hypothetical protein
LQGCDRCSTVGGAQIRAGLLRCEGCLRSTSFLFLPVVVVAQAWTACEPGCPDGERQIRIAAEFRKLWDRYRAYLEDFGTLFEDSAATSSSHDSHSLPSEDRQPQAG